MSIVTGHESFAAATAVTPLGRRAFAAHVSPRFSFGGAPNGGYLLATMLRAAVAESPHEHPIVASIEYLRVAQQGPLSIGVRTSRVSRSLSTARVAFRQHDRLVAEGLVTVGTLKPEEAIRWSGTAPRIADLEDCSVAEPSGAEGVAGQVELRFDPATDGWRFGTPAGAPELRAWFRLRDATDPDPYVLALAADALPPVIVNVGLRGWAPTVRLTWQLRALPSPGWLAVHATGRSVSHRWFDEDVEIWDERGRLVAQSRQLALVGHRHTGRRT